MGDRKMIWRRTAILLQFILVVLTIQPLKVSAAEPRALVEKSVTQALFVSQDGTYKRYRIPALLATKNGNLLAICEGRVDGRGLTGDIDLVLRRSTDGGG